MLKPNVRILGIDDGPFVRGEDRKTTLVGVLMRMDFVIESILVRYVEIDGNDVTDAISDFVSQIGELNVHAIITEGITFAGFDLVDPAEVFSLTGIPFISITRGRGDIGSMITALESHGDRARIDKLTAMSPEKIELEGSEYTLNISGIDRKEAILTASKLMRVGKVPEPVRIADMIASAIMKSRKNVP